MSSAFEKVGLIELPLEKLAIRNQCIGITCRHVGNHLPELVVEQGELFVQQLAGGLAVFQDVRCPECGRQRLRRWSTCS